jgi:hypothetical protein
MAARAQYGEFVPTSERNRYLDVIYSDLGKWLPGTSAQIRQISAFAVTWTLADATTQTSPGGRSGAWVRSCSYSHIDTGARSRIRQGGPGWGA